MLNHQTLFAFLPPSPEMHQVIAVIAGKLYVKLIPASIFSLPSNSCHCKSHTRRAADTLLSAGAPNLPDRGYQTPNTLWPRSLMAQFDAEEASVLAELADERLSGVDECYLRQDRRGTFSQACAQNRGPADKMQKPDKFTAANS